MIACGERRALIFGPGRPCTEEWVAWEHHTDTQGNTLEVLTQGIEPSQHMPGLGPAAAMCGRAQRTSQILTDIPIMIWPKAEPQCMQRSSTDQSVHTDQWGSSVSPLPQHPSLTLFLTHLQGPAEVRILSSPWQKYAFQKSLQPGN